jgi:hypothetical protein
MTVHRAPPEARYRCSEINMNSRGERWKNSAQQAHRVSGLIVG